MYGQKTGLRKNESRWTVQDTHKNCGSGLPKDVLLLWYESSIPCACASFRRICVVVDNNV